MIKVAFVGRMRSGKTELAKALYDFGGPKKLASFGKEMKKEFEKVIGEEFDKKKHRKAIQLFGQTKRSIDPDVWIRHVEKELEEFEGFMFVIDDVRQENELEWCLKNGFYVIYLDVPFEKLEERCKNLGEVLDLDHPTEQVEKLKDRCHLVVTPPDFEEEIELGGIKIGGWKYFYIPFKSALAIDYIKPFFRKQ